MIRSQTLTWWRSGRSLKEMMPYNKLTNLTCSRPYWDIPVHVLALGPMFPSMALALGVIVSNTYKLIESNAKKVVTLVNQDFLKKTDKAN